MTTSTHARGSRGPRTSRASRARRPPAGRARRPERHDAAGRPRLAVLVLPVLLVGVAGFQRRWMSDDGHIYLRTARQVLAGHGPVFNAGERAEASTGTLWQWLLVLAGLPGLDLARAAVCSGLLLTVLGFGFATLGAVRLHTRACRPGSTPVVLLPLGSLVLLALPPVWDFATSGLETGLTTCWLAGAWLRLVTRPRSAATSALLGLGPLVRPDLGLVSAVLLAAQWWCTRPPRRAALCSLAAALALPLAYEVFRAGYYGHLVPLPAVTKEASVSLWGRGLGYLADFTGPYLLWIPALVVGAAALWALRRPVPGGARGTTAGRPSARATAAPVRGRPRGTRLAGRPAPHGARRTRAPVGTAGARTVPVVAAGARTVPVGAAGAARAQGPDRARRAQALAPVFAGALCWLYVIRVGGDFMHGRMLLPGLLLMLLPVFAVPATRAWVCAVAAVGIWAVACACWLRVGYAGGIGPAGVADERGVYVRQNASAHPVHHHFAAAPRLRSYARTVRAAERAGSPALVLGGKRLAGSSPSVTGVHAVLGFDGTVVPLSGAALDPIGLGYPLAAHSEREPGGRVGHDKHLPRAWVLADRGTAADLPPGARRAQVAAARRALHCGPLADLAAATRARLTPARFWHNLTGAWRRTAFRFPADPVRAAHDMCGPRAPGAGH
ncbi:hypothetical protein [Streptomyces sulfonofaciens]|nr:hypothetical protein [Streptomyces sulfonofaciens]